MAFADSCRLLELMGSTHSQIPNVSGQYTELLAVHIRKLRYFRGIKSG
jgi:hypothetical protein